MLTRLGIQYSSRNLQKFLLRKHSPCLAAPDSHKHSKYRYVTYVSCPCSRIHLAQSSVYYNYRYFHSSIILQSKEPSSKVEETVKNLRQDVDSHAPDADSQVATTPVKRSLAKRFWDELVHYYHGFRLLGIDIKVAGRLTFKLLKGLKLSRREHKQLVRTVSDLFRLVPFVIVLIIPFMELLLPVLLKFFPSMLPSTFTTKSESELKFKKNLKVKIELAKFLQSTLDEMAVIAKGKETHSQSAKEFAEFFQRIRTTGAAVSNEEILKYSKLFEDEITLDSLTRPQLIALCRLLELQPFGTNNFLRFQLRNRIRTLRADDQIILKEGISNLTVEEIQAACRARGMRALGLPEERLMTQLKQWLELSMNEHIPNSLLLLSRALYLPEKLATTDQLKVTLSALPETAGTETKFKIGEMEGKVDNKTKLELIRHEEEEIKKEEQELKRHLEEQKKEVAQPSEKPITDTAEMLHDKEEYTLVDKAVPISKPADAKDSEELSNADFEEIESALENIASEKKRLLIEQEEIEDLKEEMAEYKQDIEELKDAVLETGHKEITESKAALRLSNKVNKMISNMDKLIDGLNQSREDLEVKIDDKIKTGTSILKERDDIVGINELVLALRRIQKVSDDTKLQKIVDVLEKMDIDHDGSVEVDHVLKVIELLGQDNVKITDKQLDNIIELLTKEESLEQEEKQKLKNSTPQEKAERQSQ